ncbi:hypothetical protein V2J09_023565 [Rumex salicifolius]
MTSCYGLLFKNLANHTLRVPLSLNQLARKLSHMETNLILNRKFHIFSGQLLGLRPKISHPQANFRVIESSFGPSKTCPIMRFCIASSSTIGPFSNDKNLVSKSTNGDIISQERVNNQEEKVENEMIIGGKGGVEHKGEDSSTRDDVEIPTRIEREESDVEREAWRLLRDSVVTYCNSPVGTVAANDPNDKQPLNYDQVFIRDFVPSALAFLLKGEAEIVKNFLLHTLQLQSWEKTVDCYSPGQGLMPASFKSRTVSLDGNSGSSEEVLDPDFGESAIGRVAPVDSGLWWIILLRAYGKLTGDYALQERVDVQTGIKLILNLCLTDGFDMFPSLLVTDGSCMIDRRMALRSSREMLTINEGSKNIIRAINNRLSALSFHIREYYWVDIRKINEIYRYKTEEYSTEATNKFNIYPDQIPQWLMHWIPEEGGYMIGNLQPAHMDFRFFTLGNLWSVISSMGTPNQNEAVLNLIDAKWEDLMADMPMKICYPAIKEEEWRIFTLACLKMGRSDLAEKAISLAEKKLQADGWPEYYDTRHGKFIGKQSRLYQTWTIAGFLTSKMLIENPEMASLLYWHEDFEILETCVCALNKSGRTKCSRGATKSRFFV